jgi:hypothetical protein
VIRLPSAHDSCTVVLSSASVFCQEFENNATFYLGDIHTMDEVSNRNILKIKVILDCRGNWAKGKNGAERQDPILPADVEHIYFPVNRMTQKSQTGPWNASYGICLHDGELEKHFAEAFEAIASGKNVPLL